MTEAGSSFFSTRSVISIWPATACTSVPSSRAGTQPMRCISMLVPG
jgi:hypothetical protein